MITETFEKLRGLQEILSRKFEVEEEIAEIPKALSTKVELLNRLKKSFVDKNDQCKAIQKRIEDLGDRAIEAERGRERFEQQMENIKTQREYETLDKEIKDASAREQELRRELQRESERLVEMQAGVEREEAMIEQQAEEVDLEKARIDQELTKKRKLLGSLMADEGTITPGLDEELLFKFERIIKSKSGVGIVPIVSGVCTGCNIVLPSHFVNTVRVGREVMFCPDCSRILFCEGEQDWDGDAPNRDEGERVEEEEDRESLSEDLDDEVEDEDGADG